MRLYSENHIWSEEGKLGISSYAASQLENIVYVQIDRGSYKKGEVFGSVESTKTVSDLIAPCDMTVLETNPELERKPELLNEDAEGIWIAKAEGSFIEGMDKEKYQEYIDGL